MVSNTSSHRTDASCAGPVGEFTREIGSLGIGSDTIFEKIIVSDPISLTSVSPRSPRS